MNNLVVTFTWTLSWLTLNAVSLRDVKRLKDGLFKDYDRDIRPALDQNRATDIHVAFSLQAIDNLDLMSQSFKWSGYFSLKWYDNMLVWNETDYDGLKSFTVPQTKIWLPDYVIDNDVQDRKALGSPETLVLVRSDGHVVWEPGVVTKTSCKVNIQKYPFDEQTCSLTLLPWMHTNISLVTRLSEDEVRMQSFIPHGEFKLTDSKVEKVEYMVTWSDGLLSSAIFFVSLLRRPTFYWLSMILPMVTFPLLCPISFLVPVENGEKMTLSITVVLAYLVFIGSMNDAMPKLSDTISLLVLYASTQTMLGILTVVANGFIIMVYKLPPDYEFCLSEIYIKLPLTSKEKTQPKRVEPFRAFVTDGGSIELPKKETTKKLSRDWHEVARMLDKVFFILFMVTAVLVTVVFGLLFFQISKDL